MDQSKTKLPSFAQFSKVDAHLARLQHHVTGVRVHHLERLYLITWTDILHPDSNVMLNSLVYVLNDISQCDNSAKDNKNAFVLIFMAWLIQLKVFKKIKLGFLMVGHTHEDVDQSFSVVATHLGKMNVTTQPILMQALRCVTSPPPSILHMTGLHDYKQAMEKCRGMFVGISTPHQFVLRQEGSSVQIRFKKWPRPSDKEEVITLPAETIPSLAGEVTAQANPKCKMETEKMMGDMRKWEASGRLSTEELGWWHRYLRRVGVPYCNVPYVSYLPQYTPYS
ncbi:hypothetical protein MAR_037487, partial [Mya arenaria]